MNHIIEDYFKNKTVLVTGATGLIGSHIVNRLLAMEHVRVIAMGRSRSKLEATFSQGMQAGTLTCMEHDISSPLPVSMDAVDLIFHAASPISGEVIRTRPLDVINSNLSGSVNCMEYLRRQGHGKMILFSSATVYSESEGHHVACENETSHATCIESTNAPYAESKRMIEVIARAYHQQYDIDMLIARFSYVYGYAKNAANTAFYEFIRKAIKGEDITMNKSGLPRRDNIYVEDAVNGLLHLCAQGVNGDVFNISSNGELLNYTAADELAEAIAEAARDILHNQVRVLYKEENHQRPEGLRLSNDKLKATGWSLQTSLKEGVRQTLNKFVEE